MLALVLNKSLTVNLAKRYSSTNIRVHCFVYIYCIKLAIIHVFTLSLISALKPPETDYLYIQYCSVFGIVGKKRQPIKHEVFVIYLCQNILSRYKIRRNC